MYIATTVVLRNLDFEMNRYMNSPLYVYVPINQLGYLEMQKPINYWDT